MGGETVVGDGWRERAVILVCMYSMYYITIRTKHGHLASLNKSSLICLSTTGASKSSGYYSFPIRILFVKCPYPITINIYL